MTRFRHGDNTYIHHDNPMPEETARELVGAAKRAGLVEICGFVRKDWTIVPVRNVHPRPEANFGMAPEELLEELRDGWDHILGVYHSHPKGRNSPSDDDVRSWPTDYRRWRYWIVTFKDVYEWSISDDHAEPVRSVGNLGLPGLAYPVLAPAEAVRRGGEYAPDGSDEER